MAFPRSHRQFLERQLEVHEQRIATIRAQQADMDAEVRIHELVISLGRDERVLRALDGLTELPDTSSAQDLESYARSVVDEIQHLQDFELTLETDTSSAEVTVRAAYRDARYPFMITWNRRGGFVATQLEPAGETSGA